MINTIGIENNEKSEENNVKFEVIKQNTIKIIN